jgi:hypothetical protein
MVFLLFELAWNDNLPHQKGKTLCKILSLDDMNSKVNNSKKKLSTDFFVIPA